MNREELIDKMIEWETLKNKLNVLEAEIKEAVLYFGETCRVDNAKATYRQGRKKYDYKSIGMFASEEIITKNSQVTTNWRQVCSDAEIEKDEIPYEQSDPSVGIQLT